MAVTAAVRAAKIGWFYLDSRSWITNNVAYLDS
jgi:hypothetical protein